MMTLALVLALNSSPTPWEFRHGVEISRVGVRVRVQTRGLRCLGLGFRITPRGSVLILSCGVYYLIHFRLMPNVCGLCNSFVLFVLAGHGSGHLDAAVPLYAAADEDVLRRAGMYVRSCIFFAVPPLKLI